MQALFLSSDHCDKGFSIVSASPQYTETTNKENPLGCVAQLKHLVTAAGIQVPIFSVVLGIELRTPYQAGTLCLRHINHLIHYFSKYYYLISFHTYILLLYFYMIFRIPVFPLPYPVFSLFPIRLWMASLPYVSFGM